VTNLGWQPRGVRAAARRMNVRKAPDARDWHQVPNTVPDYRAALDGGVKGARIAYCPEPGLGKGIENWSKKLRKPLRVSKMKWLQPISRPFYLAIRSNRLRPGRPFSALQRLDSRREISR